MYFSLSHLSLSLTSNTWTGNLTERCLQIWLNVARIRIASAMAAMVRLNWIWRWNAISFTSKFKLYKSTPSSSVAVKHGACLLSLKKGVQSFETKCMRKLLRVSCREHKTNTVQNLKVPSTANTCSQFKTSKCRVQLTLVHSSKPQSAVHSSKPQSAEHR